LDLIFSFVFKNLNNFNSLKENFNE
jgi:hypothetical protein